MHASWTCRYAMTDCKQAEADYTKLTETMNNNGYVMKNFGIPVKRYVQTMELYDDPELIEKYKQLHSRAHNWKEIRDGIRQVGILEMDIYLLGTTLVMIVETPVDFDWDSAMAKLATLPRQQEWEDTVAAFQRCAKGATSNDKWKMMSRIFHIYENED